VIGEYLENDGRRDNTKFAGVHSELHITKVICIFFKLQEYIKQRRYGLMKLVSQDLRRLHSF